MSDTTFTVEAKARPEGGFWRGGLRWDASGSVHEGLTPAQVEAVKAEPSLVVIGVFQGPASAYNSERKAQLELEDESISKAKALEAEVARLTAENAELKQQKVDSEAAKKAEAVTAEAEAQLADEKATKKGK